MDVLNEEQTTELKRIGQLESYFQQGYESAPIIFAASGAEGITGLLTYLKTSVANVWPDGHEMNHERDKGAIKWILEQMGILT